MPLRKEADVVIVGYGGAGAVAAITAHDFGAEVVVLEKSAQGGGNTRLATSSFTGVIPGEMAKEHLKRLCAGTLEEDSIEAYIEWASQNVNFLRELGGDPVPYFPGPTFPEVTGADTMLRFRPGDDVFGQGGRRLWMLLSENVEKRNIKIMTNTRVHRLIQGSGKEVIGVEATQNGSEFQVGAKRAVILTCGGFEFDEKLKREYIHIPEVYAFGHTDNTGDGIRMIQEIGGALWHMNAVACPLGYKFAEYPTAFDSNFSGPGYIAVDQYGERFMNEYAGHYTKWIDVSYFLPERLEWTRIPCFFVFDEKTRLSGPISRVNGRNSDFYQWSVDNSAEIKREWIVQGYTLFELARKMKLRDDTRLVSTVARYNHFCNAGKDDDFGRPADSLAAIEPPLTTQSRLSLSSQYSGRPQAQCQGASVRPLGSSHSKALCGGGAWVDLGIHVSKRR